MKKLCCIFNTPSLYREVIYKEIDKRYDCAWYFEDTDNKLALFDTNELRCVKFLNAVSIGPFYVVRGLSCLIKKKDYSHYLMMGHSRNISSFFLLLNRRLFFRNKRVLLWTHGLYGKESRLELTLKLFLYKMADGVFVYGDRAKGLLLKSGMPEEKVIAIHNSLDYPKQLILRKTLSPSAIYQSHFENNNKNIIFIGRLTTVKKLDLLLDAIALLKERGEFYNVTFIGDGIERDTMEQKVYDLNIRNQIWFYGACYDEKTNAEMIYNADLCVSPGNIGLTAIHVLMFGCPAVTNDDFDTQMPEYEAIKKDVTGDFFKAYESFSLANIISMWFSNHKDDRDVVRKACYDEIDKNWNPSYQMKVIQSVLF